MKSLIKALLRNIFSLIPFRLMRFFHSIWLDVIAADKDTAKAFKKLFALSDDVEIRINLVAMDHDGNGIHVKHRLMKYHDFFVERLKPRETVLDIGCGCGAVAHSMASRADAHVVGIDLIEANITQARQLYSHPKLQFILGDALVSLPSGSYET
ncbi:class I SAM-dependent methyltransferase, partial [candidate division KSB1 bacterium]|nr:class I SAM-dependent methyltransferase [candidate division KSB1 bacterium]